MKSLAQSALLRGVFLFFVLVLALSGEVAAEEGGKQPDLRTRLSEIVDSTAVKRSTASFYVVDLESSEAVLSVDEDSLMVPASTAKLLTTAVALKHLTPSFRFETTIYTDGAINSTGTLDGNLYVVGKGDPTFVVERLWKLIYDLKLEGISRVSGDVVFDESYFGSDHSFVGWSKKKDIKEGPAYYPKMSALSLNFNTTALVVAPGLEEGLPARVEVETPVGALVSVDNQVTTVGVSARRRVKVERDVSGAKVSLTATGRVPLHGKSMRVYRTVPDPTVHYVAAFKTMAKGAGIRVKGTYKLGELPDEATLVSQHLSPVLAGILMDMNKYSNNFMAEQILRTVGAEVYGAPGTTEKGVRVIEEYLTELEISPESYTIINGSGLSRDARITAFVTNAVLQDMAQNNEVGAEFQSSLSIGGQDGTLAKRLKETPGVMRGKTGTIDGVHAVAGYVTANNDKRYSFVFLANDLKSGSRQIKLVHDDLLRALVNGDNGDDVVSHP